MAKVSKKTASDPTKQEALAKMADELAIAKAAFQRAIAVSDASGVEFAFDLGVNFPHPYGDDYGNVGLGGTYHPATGTGDDAEKAYVYWDASSMNC